MDSSEEGGLRGSHPPRSSKPLGPGVLAQDSGVNNRLDASSAEEMPYPSGARDPWIDLPLECSV